MRGEKKGGIGTSTITTEQSKWRTTHACAKGGKENCVGATFVCTKETKRNRNIKRERNRHRMMPLQSLCTEKTTVQSPHSARKGPEPKLHTTTTSVWRLLIPQSSRPLEMNFFFKHEVNNNAPTYVHRATWRIPVNNCGSKRQRQMRLLEFAAPVTRERNRTWNAVNNRNGEYRGRNRDHASKCHGVLFQQHWLQSRGCQLRCILYLICTDTVFGPWKKREAMLFNNFSRAPLVAATLVKLALVKGLTKRGGRFSGTSTIKLTKSRSAYYWAF